MRLHDCHNVTDFRELARHRVPGATCDDVDGDPDDEVGKRHSAAAIGDQDLVPNILRGGGDADLSVTVMGLRRALPVSCSPPRPRPAGFREKTRLGG